MSAIDRIMYDTIYRISKPRWDDGSIPPQVAQLWSCPEKVDTKNDAIQ
jgi:hypothetical protein